jgi:hypothetical protein
MLIAGRLRIKQGLFREEIAIVPNETHKRPFPEESSRSV